MADMFRAMTSDFVGLVITTSENENGCMVERRFPKTDTIGNLKGKLELITGGNAATMTLELYNKDDNLISKLDNDEAPLGSYQVENGMRLHVNDKFLMQKKFLNSSEVEKFSLPDEEYTKRTNSVKSFLQLNKLGKYNEAEMAAKEEARKQEIEHDIELAKNIHVNDRCEVHIPNQQVRRGTVKYVGPFEDKPGIWIGVQYDEPLGKHDGKIKGRTYFECPPNYGSMVRPLFVKTGDFPEENDLDDEL